MPKYWLASKTAPTSPVLDWLKWTGQDLECHIAKSGTIGTIIVMHKMGDLKPIYGPIVIPNAFSSCNAAINGNSSGMHTEPVFVYTDASNIGLIMTVATYDDIPLDCIPEKYFSSRIVVEASWASAKVKLGMVYFPIVALLFLGRRLSNHLCMMLTLRMS